MVKHQKCKTDRCRMLGTCGTCTDLRPEQTSILAPVFVFRIHFESRFRVWLTDCSIDWQRIRWNNLANIFPPLPKLWSDWCSQALKWSKWSSPDKFESTETISLSIRKRRIWFRDCWSADKRISCTRTIAHVHVQTAAASNYRIHPDHFRKLNVLSRLSNYFLSSFAVTLQTYFVRFRLGVFKRCLIQYYKLLF